MDVVHSERGHDRGRPDDLHLSAASRIHPGHVLSLLPAGYLEIRPGIGVHFLDASTNNAFHVVSEAKTTLRKLVVNDKQVYSYDSKKGENDFNTGRSMYIFGCNKDGAPAMGMKAKLYDMKIWESDVLVRNYRPVALANGDGALFDEVNEQIYTNRGSTPFALGELPNAENRSGIVRAMSQDLEVLTDEEFQTPVVSYWVGGEDGDLSKVANWRALNRIGAELVVVPASTTEVHFSGTVNASWASASDTLGAAKIVCDDGGA